MNFRTIALSAAALAVAGVATARGQQTATTRQITTTTTVGSLDIIGTLRAAGNFTTFLQALDAAGIAERLKGAGPYTVFAPTDEAFARLPAARRDPLLADKAGLEAVLKNHIIEGRVTAEDARRDANGVGFLDGQPITVDTTGGVRVNGALVVKADIMASNGVIHAIDQVYLPMHSERVKGTTPADSAQRQDPKP